MADNIYPPWGHLPAGQYLLTRSLITRFLSLPTIPREWDTVIDRFDGSVLDLHHPTQQEVDTILARWRPQAIRVVAHTLWSNKDSRADITDDAAWVRTYYPTDPAEAETATKRWRELIDKSDMFNMHDEIASPQCTLNDRELFDSPDAMPWQEMVHKA